MFRKLMNALTKPFVPVKKTVEIEIEKKPPTRGYSAPIHSARPQPAVWIDPPDDTPSYSPSYSHPYSHHSSSSDYGLHHSSSYDSGSHHSSYDSGSSFSDSSSCGGCDCGGGGCD